MSDFYRYEGTWHSLQACKFLKLKHHIHSSIQKSPIERTMQYFNNRIQECFDGYFPYRLKNLIKAYTKLDITVYGLSQQRVNSR